jgi:pyridoxal phosphate enzyme (YggS family)
MTTQERRAELAAGLAAVQHRIEAARAEAAREDPVTLIVVTKFFPAADVELLAGLGVRDIGENRDQEAHAKIAELTCRDDLTVHFIGQLQTNKARSVARYADVVQSVDRSKLVRALSHAALEAERELGVLLQVSLDDAAEAGRGGVRPQDCRGLAETVAQAQALRLLGVMAVAPLGADPDQAFARLRTIADGLRAEHPDATWISAGMSGDLEAAVRHGATHLRVGTAILGSRPPLG